MLIGCVLLKDQIRQWSYSVKQSLQTNRHSLLMGSTPREETHVTVDKKNNNKGLFDPFSGIAVQPNGVGHYTNPVAFVQTFGFCTDRWRLLGFSCVQVITSCRSWLCNYYTISPPHSNNGAGFISLDKVAQVESGRVPAVNSGICRTI